MITFYSSIIAPLVVGIALVLFKQWLDKRNKRK